MEAFRRKSPTYLVVSGFVLGCLVAGLLVPLAFRSSTPDVITTTSAAGALGDAADGGDTGSLATGDVTGDTNGGVGVDGSGGGTTANSVAAGGGAAAKKTALTASDVGVTPSTITIGAIVQDAAGAGKAGFGAAAGLSPDQQQAAYDTFIKAVNEAGGINGRRIVPTYYTVDIANPDSQRAACLNFTQDKKVFAVLSTPGFPLGARCVTEENHTPLIIGDSQGIPTEWINESRGLMSVTFPASMRMMAGLVDTVDGMGLLKGGTIGVLSDETDNGKLARDTALLPALKAKGYKAAYVSHLSADGATAVSQIPVEVQKFRNANVDRVLVITNVLTALQFAQTADGQGYRPKYMTPDWGAASDAGWENAPASWDGTYVSAITMTDYAAGRGDSPAQARCRRIYESATGDHLKRDSSGDALKMDYTLFECDFVDIFTNTARAAGPNLTRASFVSAMQHLPAFALSAWGPGQFGPGKFEYSDRLRPNKWQANCKCFVPLRDF